MPDVIELGRILSRTDRKIVTIQGMGVDVDEAYLIPGLIQAVAKVGVYQIWLCSAQDSIRVLITLNYVPAGESLGDMPGDVVCDQPVDFYHATVTIVAGTSGVQGQFILPNGAGRYRVIVTTDREVRRRLSRLEQEIIMSATDPESRAARLAEHDGREWYTVTFQYLGPVVNGDEDNEDDEE